MHPLPVTPRATRLLAHIGTMYPVKPPSQPAARIARTSEGTGHRRNPGALQIFISDINTATMPNLALYERMVKEGAIVFGKQRVPRAEALRITQEARPPAAARPDARPRKPPGPRQGVRLRARGPPHPAVHQPQLTHRNDREEMPESPSRIVYRDDAPDRIDLKW